MPVSSLRLTRRFAAPRERLFRAWTDPRQLSRWFRPAPDYLDTQAEVDLQVGGRYRLGMRKAQPEAPPSVVGGVYEEITPPERLVFTWRWEGEQSGSDMRVTVEFLDHGGETEIVLTHELFASDQSRTQHAHGWEGCLGQLDAMLRASQ
ncbi:MAG TPA: SRPBCC domain-containing protein [Thermoanaerobaculia bacterium]|nr:SRPBCC domain-containing protein [Thermoanaerobaculia bacterium]